jgi:adenylate cyclase
MVNPESAVPYNSGFMARSRETGKLLSAVLAGLSVGAVLVLLARADSFRALEWKAYDVRMGWLIGPEPPPGKPPPPVRKDIELVIVTDDCIEALKSQGMGWPWDRRQFAKIIRACSVEDFSAAVLLFDFFTLCDPDPYHGEPAVIEALKGPTPVYLCVPFKKRDSDRSLPRADRRPDLELLLNRYAIDVESDGSVQVAEIPDRYVVLPVPGVAEAAAGVCDVETPEDTDGITRRYQVFSRFRGRYYPSFALAALMAREKTRTVRVHQGTVTVGKVSFPVEPNGTLVLRYYHQGRAFPWWMAQNVLEGFEGFEKTGKITKFDPSQVADKIVLVGTNAAALFDLKATPVSETMPGVEIHAIALANILNGQHLRPVRSGLVALAVVGISLLGALVTRLTGPLAGGLASAALFLGVGGGNVALFRAGWAADLLAPLAAVVLSYAVTSALNFLYEGRQRRRVKREFQRYLSPRVVEKILRSPGALSEEGERKTLSIFFLDFAGFTSMSEKLDPGDLVKLMSEYHNETAEEIFKTEGTLDKFIGDAIMAFWNDPLRQDDHAFRACFTAVAAQERMRDMARKMRDRGLPEMRARIGINSGVAIVGNMGAKGQVNYTLIGDEVNLASRLEGVNKEFGTDIIISEATYLLAKDRLAVRELALIKVKGKKQPVRIFELLAVGGPVDPARMESARAFEKALGQFRARKFQAAWEAFLTLAHRKDRAAEVYLGLCERYLHDAPPEDWDGSYQMETK